MNSPPDSSASSKDVRIFISYSHQDLFWMQKLKSLLYFPGVHVESWTDEQIDPGQLWDVRIRRELAEMDVFIPLVSVNFAVSRYIGEVECPIAKERHEKKEIEIVPVLVHHPGQDECAWLMALQRVPPGEKSWVEIFRDFKEYDMAAAPIRDGIKAVVARAQQRK